MAATWASPCTAIASMPGLPTRRAIARASRSAARAPSTSPPSISAKASDHLFLRVLGALRRLGQVLGGSDVAGEGHRAVEHHRVVAGLLQGHAGGTCDLTCVGERHLRPFEGVQEPGRITGPAARPGEPLEVVGPERLIGVGVPQRGPRRGPLALAVCGSGVVEERLTRGHAASLSCRMFGATLPSGRRTSLTRVRSSGLPLVDHGEHDGIGKPCPGGGERDLGAVRLQGVDAR